MSLHNDHHDKIDAYLFGHLSASEKEDFEKQLAENEDLAADLAVQELTHRSMELLARQDLRNNLNSWKEEKKAAIANNEKQETKVISINRRSKFLRYAVAAIALFIASFFLWNLMDSPLDNQAVAFQWLEKTSNSRSKGLEGNSVPQSLAPGLKHLSDGNYEAAIRFFENVSDSLYIDQALLLKGEALIRQKNYHEAANIYQQILSNNTDPLTAQEAEWHLLLTWLASDQYSTNEFSRLLESIASKNGHPYQNRAVELSKQLE